MSDKTVTVIDDTSGKKVQLALRRHRRWSAPLLHRFHRNLGTAKAPALHQYEIQLPPTRARLVTGRLVGPISRPLSS